MSIVNIMVISIVNIMVMITVNIMIEVRLDGLKLEIWII